MPREILVHLNVTLPDHDDRTAEDIAKEVEAGVLVAAPGYAVVALAEEV